MATQKVSVNIIGSGIGGLSVGAILAKHGFKVNVFEAKSKIGGYATAWKKKDFLFEGSLHELNGFYPDDKKLRLFRYLGLFNRIKLLPIPSPYTSLFDDYQFKVPHGYDQFRQEMMKEFPEDAKAIEKIFTLIQKASYSCCQFMQTYTNYKDLISLPQKNRFLIFNFYKTLHSSLKKIKNPYARTIIGQLYLYYSENTALSMLAFSTPTYSFCNESYWISGTSNQLALALGQIILENGGEIHTNSPVTEVIFKNKKAVGIKVNHEKEYFSDITVCNTPLKYTVDTLIGKKNVPWFYRLISRHSKLSTSIFSLYIGLDIDAKQLGITEYCYMLNQSKNLNQINNDQDFSQRPLVLVNYNLDQSLAPAGKSVLSICITDKQENWPSRQHSREEYLKAKNEKAQIALDRVEKMFPGFKDHIEVMDIATPYTMERFSNNTKGAVYGASQSITQANIFRLPNEIKKGNLYFCSAWVYPSGGLSGVFIAANITVEQIFAHYNIKNQLLEYTEPLPQKTGNVYSN